MILKKSVEYRVIIPSNIGFNLLGANHCNFQQTSVRIPIYYYVESLNKQLKR